MFAIPKNLIIQTKKKKDNEMILPFSKNSAEFIQHTIKFLLELI